MILILILTIPSLLTSGVSALGETCTHAIDRLRKGPDMFTDIVAASQTYEDESFNGRNMLYWLTYSDLAMVREYETNLWWGNYSFQRVADVYPDATLFGSDNPQWHDIMQGNFNTSYIEAALGALAEFPAVVKNVFLTQEKNDAGIYAFKFHIRGKPWVVTVDDTFLFMTNATDGTRIPYFSGIGRNQQFWGMLLQKAWAKVKGTYDRSDLGGFGGNGLAAFVDCPVASYSTAGQDADLIFTSLKSANDLSYIMTAGTANYDDTVLNACGIREGHDYSLIAAFELETSGTVDFKMYMLRDPFGNTAYNGSFNENDSAWTSSYRGQVPNSVDPTDSTSTNDGIFFVTSTDFLTCFSDFQIAHYRESEGFQDTWYDRENDWGYQNTYSVNVPAVNGDLYFHVDTYFYNMVPSTCWENGQAPSVVFSVYKGSVDAANLVQQYTYINYFHYPVQVLSSEYSAGDTFYMTVKYTWTYGFGSYPAKDYTVHVYSKQDLTILDANNLSNMWHMDGQFPTAYTVSHYRTDSTSWSPGWMPRSLEDCWIASNNVWQFLSISFSHFWVYFWWFTITLW